MRERCEHNSSSYGICPDCFLEETERDKKRQQFIKLTEPLIEYMNNFHPHHILVIDSVSAELLEGQLCYHTEKYLKD